MADEWWNSARSGGASACSTAPVTDKAAASGWTAESTTSSPIDFQDHRITDQQSNLPDAASSYKFLADPHLDWTQAFMSGKAEATSFDMSHGFLLDQTSLAPPSSYSATTASASAQCLSMYAEASYGDMPTMTPFSQLMKSSASPPMQQQFSGSAAPSGFFSAAGLFESAPSPSPSQLLLQALEPSKHLKSNTEPIQDACSLTTRRSATDSPQAVAKKPRIETPSPLPTFKVRKEKLGDRITALQQLVSPFGKTDTASVLHEATEYIKFLHDQVASLSSPYLRSECSVQLQHKGSEEAEEGGEARQDLHSRGLCLVPVASTYTVASEAAPEFWHPTFGGTFR